MRETRKTFYLCYHIMEKKNYVTLLQLSQNIKAHLESVYTREYYVKAEIVKLNYYKKSGHCFPDLAEKEKGVTMAQMRSTLWAQTYKKVNADFIRITREPLHEGMTVLLKVRVNYHEIYGISLNITDIEPRFTLGEMAREKQAAIESLKKEKLFDKNKKHPAPLLIKRIAVISVNTSKGYSDFVQTLNNPEHPFMVEHTLFPSLLQGDKAVDSLVRALQRIKKEHHKYDAAAIIRGGGDDVGLNCYDHYDLCKIVADFPIPVITGIGHSTNETVCEMVSYKNRITPTDVAYGILNDYSQLQKRVEYAGELIRKEVPQMMKSEQNRLQQFTGQLQGLVRYKIRDEKNKVFNLTTNLDHRTQKRMRDEKSRLEAMRSGLSSRPLSVIKESGSQISHRADILNIKVREVLKKENEKIRTVQKVVKWADPVHTLKRGYSITLKNGKAVTKVDQLKPGDRVTTKFAKGKAESEITKVN